MKPKRWIQVCAVAVLACLAFVGLGGWAVSSPVGASPDDDYHLVSIWCAWGDREGLCAPGAAPGERTVSDRLLHAATCYGGQPEESAACVRLTDTGVSTSRGNFTGNYPPVFYATMGIFAGPDVGLSTLVMRLFNAALFVGAAVAVVSMLRRGQRGPLLWGAAVTMVPLGMFIVPSINPSSWAVLSGLLLWISLVGYFTALRRGTRIALGVTAAALAVIGAGSRGDAAAYAALAAVVASILTFSRTREWMKLAILPAAVVLIGAVFFLSTGQSASYAGAGVAQGSADLQGGGSTGAAAAGGSSFSLMLRNLVMLPELWGGMLGMGRLGWLDTDMPGTVVVTTLAAFFGVLIWGLRVLSGRKLLALGLTLLALIVVPLYVLYGLQARVGTEVQPRYLLPLLAMFAGIMIYGATRDDLGLNRLQALIVLFSLAAANSLALYTNLRRYLTGTDFMGINLNDQIEWWWPTPVRPMTVWFVGSAAFALFLLGIYVLLFTRFGRRIMPQNTEAGPVFAPGGAIVAPVGAPAPASAAGPAGSVLPATREAPTTGEAGAQAVP